MTSAQVYMMIVMAVYLLIVILIGVRCSEKNKNVDDFYLGGRKLGPLVTAMSAEASDMSSWLLMGLPGVAYLAGVADAGWTAIGLAVGTYLNWLIVAKRLRKYSEVCNNSITIPEFFSNRFREKKNILMALAALIIVIFFIPYTASGFAACGKLFGSLFGVDYHVAMVISAAVIIAYTCLGGFLAASTTDFMQSIVMTAALIVVLVFGTVSAGGISAVIENAKSLAGYISFTATHNASTNSAEGYGFITIISTTAWGLGYFGMPHILLRFMAIDDSKKLKLSRRIASIWVVISLAVGVVIGIVGNAMSAKGVIPVLEGSDSETIIVRISNYLSSFGIMPAIIAGVILAGILASTMSTADSQLLAASSGVSHNIIAGLFKVKTSEKVSMLIARLTLVVIAVIGIVLAWDPNSSVFAIVSFAWAGFGAAFGPVMLFSLFWKRMNKWGAFAGMLSGGAVVFIWKYAVRPLGGTFNIYELLPAFIVACIFIIVVSIVTPKPSKEIQDEFELVNQMKEITSEE